MSSAPRAQGAVDKRNTRTEQRGKNGVGESLIGEACEDAGAEPGRISIAGATMRNWLRSANADPQNFRLVVGILLTFYSLFALLVRHPGVVERGGRGLDALFGLIGGVLCGLGGMPGFAPAICTELRGWRRDLRRATMQAYNIAMHVVTITVYGASGTLAHPALARYFDKGHRALGSDFFRYALQAKGFGYWVDLDFFFLRPLDFRSDYVFGWERETSINGAILRLPPDSALVRELCEIPQANWRPLFYGPRKTVQFYLRRLSQGDIRPENYRWGTFGPAVLTYLAKKHRVASRAQKRPVFYPILHSDAAMVCGPPEWVERQLTRETRAVHLWSSVLSREARIAPPGSWLEVVCRRHGLTPAGAEGGCALRHEARV